jgi:hypothetical protein
MLNNEENAKSNQSALDSMFVRNHAGKDNPYRSKLGLAGGKKPKTKNQKPKTKNQKN